MTPQDVINSARSFVATPFSHHGRLKGVGIDCVGLLLGVAEEIDIPLPNIVDYQIPDKKGTLVDTLRKLEFKQVNSVSPGMIVTFAMIQDWPACHAGITTDKGIIHVISGKQKRGGCVEHDYTEFWKKHLKEAFEFPGIEY